MTTELMLLIPIGLIAMVAFWCGTVWLVSRFGWSTLASHHRHEGALPSDRIGSQSGMINSARYGRALVVGWDAQALYLDTVLVFRPGHRPLRIPFSAIIARRPAQSRRFGALVELVVRAGEGTVRVAFTSKTAALFPPQLATLPAAP